MENYLAGEPQGVCPPKTHTKCQPSSFFNIALLYINPLSPNIHIQILQTDLYAFPYRMS